MVGAPLSCGDNPAARGDAFQLIPHGLLESGHEITARDLHAHIVQRAQQDLDRALRPEFDGIAVTRLLLRGDPAREIVETARNRNVDLIVMATSWRGVFYRLSAGIGDGEGTARNPVPGLDRRSPRRGTGGRVLDPSRPLFGGIEPHSRHTVSLAASLAAATDATLTLVHITASVEFWGPGGSHIDPVWKEKIVGFAAEEIAKLQQDMGTKAEVIIDSGNVPELLNRAAERTKADVLVIGHIPGRSHLGDNGNGYGIIRAVANPGVEHLRAHGVQSPMEA